jgi:hypothetical protein
MPADECSTRAGDSPDQTISPADHATRRCCECFASASSSRVRLFYSVNNVISVEYTGRMLVHSTANFPLVIRPPLDSTIRSRPCRDFPLSLTGLFFSGMVDNSKILTGQTPGED